MANYWSKLSENAYKKVEKQFPIDDNTPTRINNDGEIVNMSREAMLARVLTLRDDIRDTFLGEYND